MKQQLFRRHYPMKKGTGIDVQLSVIFYEEDNIHYAYCAALDVLGYGNTEDEAKESFEIMIKEILTDAVTTGTLSSLLHSYGWVKNQPPKTSDLINSNDDLAEIVNNKSYKTVLQSVHIPCVA